MAGKATLPHRGPFPVTTRSVNGQPMTVFPIECVDCGEEIVVPRRTIKNLAGGAEAVHERTISRVLDDAGWSYKKHIKQPRCEACTAKKEVALAAAQHKEKPPMTTKPTATAAKPNNVTALHSAPPDRKPTREDNNRIFDALESVYNREASRYVGTNSDQSVADGLDLPRVWVEAIREQFFGDAGDNEARAIVEEIAKRAKAACDEADSLIEKAMSQVSDARRLVEDMERRLRR